MALTAKQMYLAAGIRSEQFQYFLVEDNAKDNTEDPLTQEDKREAVIQYIKDNVLPGAIGEVAIALRSASGSGSVEEMVECRFPDISKEEADQLISEGEALFDSAVRSLGRAEIEEVIASDRPIHNETSSVNRREAKEKIDRLIAWATMVLQQLGGDPLSCDVEDDPKDPSSRFRGRMVSMTVPLRAVW